MIKRLPPYGRQLVIPDFPYLMIFVGTPACWQQAKKQQAHGFFNHLCLPIISDADQYLWPVEGLPVAAIIYGEHSAEAAMHFVRSVLDYKPQELAVRTADSQHVITYQVSEQ